MLLNIDRGFRPMYTGLLARINAGNLANKCAARMPQHGPRMAVRGQHGGPIVGQLSGVFNYAPLLTDWSLMRTDVKRGRERLKGLCLPNSMCLVTGHGQWTWAWTCYIQQLLLINWRQAGNSNEALLRFLLMAKLAAPMCVGDSHR